MKESAFQKKISKLLKAYGAVVFNVHGHAEQAAGWPDLQVYSRLWTGHLELKGPRTRVEPLQVVQASLIWRSGTDVFVLRAPKDRHETRDWMTLEDFFGNEIMRIPVRCSAVRLLQDVSDMAEAMRPTSAEGEWL